MTDSWNHMRRSSPRQGTNMETFRFQPLSGAHWSRLPLPSSRSSQPSSIASPSATSPSSPPQSSQPEQQRELLKLPPLLSDTPLPKPTHTRLPSIRELFPIFPPELPPSAPKNPIPDINTLFALLVPRNKPPAPFDDNAGDVSVRLQVCAACGSDQPTMACPNCRLLHYCNSRTCLIRDLSHQPTCARYNNVAAMVYAHPHDYAKRLELIQIVEALFKQQRTQHLLQLAIWHRNEIIRLSQNDYLKMHLEFPFNLLRTGENDAVVSFVRHWALKSSGMISDAERYQRSAPGDRTYPVDLDRYEDPLSENFPRGVVPLTHLVALCLVKIRIIASMNARMADDRQKTFWESSFGKNLSATTGLRLDDFFVRGGRSRDIGQAQVSMLTRYLLLVRESNPIMEYVIRDSNVLRNGPPGGYEASFGEAKGIWDTIGDLFFQIPGYPSCVF